ncbi:MAG: penicillin-binding protein 1A [Pseudomonadota bacterium]
MKTKLLLRIGILGISLGTALAIGVAGAIFAAYHYAKPGLPEAATVRDIPLQVPLRIYSRDGRLIQEIGEQRRLPITYDQVPAHVVNAFVSAEDKRFFQHWGVDPFGILRAAVRSMLTGREVRGTSTLTQQLARDYFLSRERKIIRKIKEAFLAYKIEQEFSKQEIMALFLNKMFFGQRAYGVAAAGQIYFDKDLADLNIAEAATLAGVLPAPSRYNPVAGPEYAKDRRRYVLGRMLDLGYITEEEWQTATDHPMLSKLHGPDIELAAPYLAEMVRIQMMNDYGAEVTTRGFRVYTTIDSTMQQSANYAVRDGLLEYDRRHGFRGATDTLDLETATETEIEETLANLPSPGGLRPALVTAIDEERNTARLRFAGGETSGIMWRGMSWAVPFINRSVVGNKPENVTDILSAGDVIYAYQTVSGDYALAQIPEAQGAIVAVDPLDGAVAALTGGFDYATSKFNRVTQAKRQPGSSFKPFIYSAALANGFTAASVVNDNPVVIESDEYEGVWRPKNSTGRFYGPTRVRNALVRSMNLVSVRMMLEMGVVAARRHIAQFGFDDTALPANLSLALGSGGATPLDMARGYAVLANGGYAVEPYFIDRIELSDGELLYQAEPIRVCQRCEQSAPAIGDSEPVNAEDTRSDDATLTATGDTLAAFWGDAQVAKRVVPATNIWIVQDLMRDVVRRGTGRRALTLNRRDLAGKTGTSNDQRDAWFGGFNPDLVAISWVGFDNDEPLGAGEEGGRTALPMWIHFMRDAMAGAPERRYPQPQGLVTVRVDPETGQLASATSSNFVFETFEAGTEPKSQGVDGGIDPYNEEEESVGVDEIF